MAEGTSIGEGAELDGALVGRSCKVGNRVRLLEGSAIGDEVEVGERATVSAGVSVFPGESVESGAEVTEDVL